MPALPFLCPVSYRLRPYALALLALLGTVHATTAAADNVSVAVAANFAAPMQKIAAAFEQDTGHKVLLSLGATGSFYAQIRNGAPFEVLLSADATTPERLEREGLGQPGSRFTYAIGRLVLWSAQPDLVDDQGTVLRAGAFERLAIANPRLAPYGAAALQTLQNLGLEQRLTPRLVQGESIAQVWQFVATGNAALGFVALSQLKANPQAEAGSAWLVPAGLHQPIRQDALLLNPGKGRAGALALLAWLKTEKARAIIRAYGYTL